MHYRVRVSLYFFVVYFLATECYLRDDGGGMMLDISALIPIGRDNAISREQLSKQTGYTDRSCRNLIEEARNDGKLIINLQDGSGYFQISDEDVKDLDTLNLLSLQYRQDRARALSILKRNKKLRKLLKEAGMEV